MSEAQPLLRVRGVKTFYGKIIALKGVDIDVNQGEIVTMIGANGAGKSTLMMTIFGNPQAREGTVTYDGRDITRMPSHEIARLGIAQSPEGRGCFDGVAGRNSCRFLIATGCGVYQPGQCLVQQ